MRNLFGRRGADPDLRQRYRDVADGILPIHYFRRLAARATADTDQPSGAADPTAAYVVATRHGTEESFTDFMDEFPNSPLAGIAQGELDALRADPTAAYVVATQRGTKESFTDFIGEFPNSPLAGIAQGELDALRTENRTSENTLFESALEEDTPEAWNNFIDTYPDGRFIGDAMERRKISGLSGFPKDIVLMQ